jgi:hypothetical protein
MSTLSTELSPTETSLLSNPINEKLRTTPEPETVKEYLPSASVTVPLVVPFTSTFTPGRAEPSSGEVTLPVMVRSWARAIMLSPTVKYSSRNLFIRLSLGLDSQSI